MGHPYFFGTSNPTEAKVWILKMEKFFATFLLDKQADHWWRMTKRLLEDQEPIAWRRFREAFYKKYFHDNVRQHKVEEFVI